MSAVIIPALRYTDASAAIEFICGAFGFTQHLVVPGEHEGEVAHAQLRFGNAMVMLGTAKDDAFGRTGPASIVVTVDDVDAHHARAAKAGAEIVMAPEDQPYGGRLYVARDAGGNLWSFGSYDPWAS